MEIVGISYSWDKLDQNQTDAGIAGIHPPASASRYSHDGGQPDSILVVGTGRKQMSDNRGTVEIRTKGMKAGRALTPDTYDTSEIRQFLEHVDKLLFPSTAEIGPPSPTKSRGIRHFNGWLLCVAVMHVLALLTGDAGARCPQSFGANRLRLRASLR